MPPEPEQDVVDWAHTYDAYQRLAASPFALDRLLAGVREAFATNGAVPDWCGVDLLRGWAFFLARADRQAGGGTLGTEWAAVLGALVRHPDASARDRPPGPAGPAGSPEPVALPTTFSTEPKRHRDPAFLAAKRARLWQSHIAPLNHFVDRIRTEIRAENGLRPDGVGLDDLVPYLDPDSGGVRARVLFVLESPAGPAALGSGMLSADNDDETAKNVWRAYEASGMPRTLGLHWNAVPWYVGDGARNAGVTDAHVTRGRRYLLQLLDQAPEIVVVVALGKKAQASVAGTATALAARGIELIQAPHPSPRPAARSQGRSLMEINAAFAEALRIARRQGVRPHGE